MVFPGKLIGVSTEGSDCSTHRGDGHLWVVALGLSVLANTGLLALFGFAALKAEVLRQKSPPPTPPPPPSVVMIFPEIAEPHITPAEKAPATSPPPPTQAALATHVAPATSPRFARTSADQSAPRPENPAFLGERDTRATSDRAPTPSAAPLPSQAGVAPKDPTQIETTHSDYQDGQLDAKPNTRTEATDAPTPASSPQEMAANPTAEPTPISPVGLPTPGTRLLDGPNPVDVPTPREPANTQAAHPPPQSVSDANLKPSAPSKALKPADPLPSAKSPVFKGFQRKTAVIGSISRTGRSALDVADSPLGRYQAALSRAVEQEWQRNCVRHRDFITPGFLTVRFFVETSGKVRSVQFVGDMETGEVQKGFTLNAIRDAQIPAMPAALRREYDQDPLELIFRFYF